MTACARTNTIAALLAGAVDPSAAARLELHLDECSACRRLVADLGRGLSAVGEAAPTGKAQGLPRPGESIGRYEIKRVLGVGGMGVVYEAHDATLDRCVAVKLLRPDLLDGPSLLAEAQAMAKLQHPNIVGVHDAGIANGQLFVCMEYVAGATLRAWTAQPRAWREIVAVFAAAGEGLAYVHRAGLVHLDFKPDNVLVDRDGRVRVTDFGLARMIGASPTGAIVGTPAYMAPEQRSGAAPDARSDQYAFCVALREALAGARVPRALDRVIERGMAPPPDDRFATLDELLAAIAAAVAPRRRRGAAAAVVGAAALAALAVTALPRSTITRIVERPIAQNVIEYRDRVGAADPVAAIETASVSPIFVTVEGERRAPALTSVAARGFVPTRRPPVLQIEPAEVSHKAAAHARTVASEAAPNLGVGHCDDGSLLTCNWPWAPACPTGTIVAIQQGCWTCADTLTCGPLGFPRSCNDGSQLRCTAEPPACGDKLIASVRDGCWSCEDPFSCWSWTKQPSAPPPRPPPRDTGSNSGSNGSDGPSCGNGFCEGGETHASCDADCCETTGSGACVAHCGNGFCEDGESHASCATDCCETNGSGGCI